MYDLDIYKIKQEMNVYILLFEVTIKPCQSG